MKKDLSKIYKKKIWDKRIFKIGICVILSAMGLSLGFISDLLFGIIEVLKRIKSQKKNHFKFDDET
ncbi:hypothetical protein BpHYR1_032166 [Brachionus plicatilis]|uniref:Uncharacterized protein n=1 Tax=Brachionus plicatilis TaxID=10195 RepID=A0A3M7Q9Y4_BRAPC|nr:hypothetical protein BpHYR1_032166 [Brachionus plicatilis]